MSACTCKTFLVTFKKKKINHCWLGLICIYNVEWTELRPVCLNALFSVLKRKVTVGKDTQNIKRAVCCSEVGPIDETARCKQGHHPNDFCPEQCIICWSNRNLDLICCLSSDF